MSCKICQYFFQSNLSSNMAKSGEGICRRYPPVLDPNYFQDDEDSITEDSSYWVQPITCQTDYCGEFAHKYME